MPALSELLNNIHSVVALRCAVCGHSTRVNSRFFLPGYSAIRAKKAHEINYHSAVLSILHIFLHSAQASTASIHPDLSLTRLAGKNQNCDRRQPGRTFAFFCKQTACYRSGLARSNCSEIRFIGAEDESCRIVNLGCSLPKALNAGMTFAWPYSGVVEIRSSPE